MLTRQKGTRSIIAISNQYEHDSDVSRLYFYGLWFGILAYNVKTAFLTLFASCVRFCFTVRPIVPSWQRRALGRLLRHVDGAQKCVGMFATLQDATRRLCFIFGRHGDFLLVCSTRRGGAGVRQSVRLSALYPRGGNRRQVAACRRKAGGRRQ